MAGRYGGPNGRKDEISSMVRRSNYKIAEFRRADNALYDYYLALQALALDIRLNRETKQSVETLHQRRDELKTAVEGLARPKLRDIRHSNRAFDLRCWVSQQQRCAPSPLVGEG